MANEIFEFPTAKGLPIPYITAVWSGMDRTDIVAGLRAGTILVPPGMSKDWLPPDASSASQQSDANASLANELPAVANQKSPGKEVSVDAQLKIRPSLDRLIPL